MAIGWVSVHTLGADHAENGGERAHENRGAVRAAEQCNVMSSGAGTTRGKIAAISVPRSSRRNTKRTRQLP